jgi:2-keto-3-deoxy-L-rhamnonate aldolase RhmA
VDALIVGTTDLSFALGVPARLDAPELLAAVRSVREACAGTAAFGLAGALDGAPPALLAGAAIAIHGTDARVLAAAADQLASRILDQLTP